MDCEIKMTMARAKTILKIMAFTFLTIGVLLGALACQREEPAKNDKSESDLTPQEFTHRGPVDESVILREAELEKIAKYLKTENKSMEIIVTSVGSLIGILLGGLLFVLRWMISEAANARREASEIKVVVAGFTQWSKDFDHNCTMNRSSIERDLQDHENRIRTIERKRE